jgi:hypothetical protein
MIREMTEAEFKQAKDAFTQNQAAQANAGDSFTKSTL